MKVDSLTRFYACGLLVVMALTPLGAIAYLANFSAMATLCVQDHAFHEAAIAVATLLGGFVAYVSWRSYQASGEVFLRWLTAGFLLFTLIYAPHGLLTRMASQNIWLFLLYGPVSRLAMMVCLIYGLTQYGKAHENPAQLARSGFWRRLLWLCLVIDVAVALLAYSPIAGSPALRMSMETTAALLCLVGIGLVAWQRIDSSLIKFYSLALAFFAQAALAFMLAKPWDHLWWLAHAIFAGGFLILSHGVARALLTTRSFALAHSPERLMRSLAREKAQSDAANLALREAQRIGGVGSYHFDLVSDVWNGTAQFDAILGIDADYVRDPAGWWARLHPDDIEVSRAAWRNALATDGIDREFRIVRADDGAVRWVRGVGRISCDRDGKPLALVGTCQDITERRHLQQTLTEAKEAAEAANRAKSTFLATMSHELRTPLNGVLGMAQLLQDSALAAEQREQVDIIVSSGNDLLALLNDVLDFSKIEAGKIEIVCSACQPMQVAGDTVALFAQLASVKGLALDCHWRGAPPPVYDIDAVRLRQMLSNFISNAIKFTASGFVRVEARELESRDHQALVEFAVIDSGIGIAPDKRDLLFQPFSQADSGVSRRYGGTGLGLSIVGRLAALMGGTAGFESEPGKGSRFWFRIRADVLAPGAQAIASAASWD